MPLTRLLLAYSCVSLVAAADDLPFLHPLFSDHAVLQQQQPVPIWGWTTPGAQVRVTFGSVALSSTAGSDGRWQVLLPPQTAGPARDLAVSGPQQVVRRNIVMGEVWLCSGQSNMQWQLQKAAEGAVTVAASTDPDLRLFQVGNAIATRPAQVPRSGSWQTSSPATAATFSAVGWHFGHQLRRQLGVPVGLIHASWGGTPLESWVSPAALAEIPGRKATVRRLESDLASLERDFQGDNERQRAVWWAGFDPGSAGNPPTFADPLASDEGWTVVDLMPKTPAGHGATGPGVFWYRCSVDLPDRLRGQALILDLPKIGGEDRTWINGVLVGDSFIGWNDRQYHIPANLTTSGRVVVAVRIFTSSTSGGFQPGTLRIRQGSQVVADLTKGWRWKAGPPFHHDQQPPMRLGSSPFVATGLYQGMIHPLQPSALAGLLWYQGEANTSGHGTYQAALTSLITSWRSGFGRELPFGIVQLANYGPRHQQPAESPWASLRAAQAATARSVPRTGIAVTMDIGDGKDIHPTNKREVGRRLSLWALHEVYGDSSIVWSGPSFVAQTIDGSRIRITFDHAEGLRAAQEPLEGFAVAGADGRYQWAAATIEDGAVVVESAKVPQPLRVRYAWDEDPAGNLVNAAGLPAIPFQSAP